MFDDKRCKFGINTEGELFHKNKLLDKAYIPDSDEQWVIDKCRELQRGANWGRFRVYGGLYKGEDVVDEARIVVVTEFIRLVEDNTFWLAVSLIARHTGAAWWLMYKRKGVDKTTYGGPHPKAGTVVYGHTHGKMIQQVELSWRVEALNYAEFSRLIRRLTAVTDEIWTKGGVGVC
jgi:hypothetical protein